MAQHLCSRHVLADWVGIKKTGPEMCMHDSLEATTYAAPYHHGEGVFTCHPTAVAPTGGSNKLSVALGVRALAVAALIASRAGFT